MSPGSPAATMRFPAITSARKAIGSANSWIRSRVWTVLRFGVPLSLPPLFGNPFGLPGLRLAGGAAGAGAEVLPSCNAPSTPPGRSGVVIGSRPLSGTMTAAGGVPGAFPAPLLVLVFSAVMLPAQYRHAAARPVGMCPCVPWGGAWCVSCPGHGPGRRPPSLAPILRVLGHVSTYFRTYSAVKD